MKTVRVFTVEVSGCDSNCPMARAAGSDWAFCVASSDSHRIVTYMQNRNAITPTCPCYGETIVKEVKE